MWKLLYSHVRLFWDFLAHTTSIMGNCHSTFPKDDHLTALDVGVIRFYLPCILTWQSPGTWWTNLLSKNKSCECSSVVSIHMFHFKVQKVPETKRKKRRESKKRSFSPFLPCCLRVFAESWMELPWSSDWGNIRSAKFPSVLSRATSNSTQAQTQTQATQYVNTDSPNSHKHIHSNAGTPTQAPQTVTQTLGPKGQQSCVCTSAFSSLNRKHFWSSF